MPVSPGPDSGRDHANGKPYVRSAYSKRSGQRYGIAAAFANAWHGLSLAIRTERNLKIDLCFGAAAIALGMLFRIDGPSWLAVIVCIGMMLALETLNTAIEAVVDLASPEYHDLARKAKDCAAGAALAGAGASAVVGAVVFVPPALRLFGLGA